MPPIQLLLQPLQQCILFFYFPALHLPCLSWSGGYSSHKSTGTSFYSKLHQTDQLSVGADFILGKHLWSQVPFLGGPKILVSL